MSGLQIEKLRRLETIDGLRGIAATWVFFYHIWNRYFPNMSTQGHAFHGPESSTASFWLTFPIFSFGYFGVGLFFVLSGFCIHLPQAKRFHRDGQHGLALSKFARARFWRLYPAYFASLILTSVVLFIFPALLALSQHVLPSIHLFHLRDAAINGLFLQHIWPDTLEFNGVYWTLLYEVQFYAFYPLLLIVHRRAGFPFVLCALFTIEAATAYHPLPVANVFITRYFEWYLGLLAAELFVRRIWVKNTAIYAALAIALATSFTFSAALIPFRDVILAIGFFWVVMYAIQKEAGAREDRAPYLLRHSGLLFLGTISYSLYLIHIPLIDLVWNGAKIASRHGLNSIVAHWIVLLCVPFAIGMAALWYRLIEVPFQLGRQTPASTAFELKRDSQPAGVTL